MASVKSDIEIARSSKMKLINDVLAKLNIPDEPTTFSPMAVSYTHLTLPTKA